MNHQQTIAQFGLEDCLWAYRQNKAGEGPANIACALVISIASANRAIDAGRWFVSERLDDADNSDAGLPPFNYNLTR